MQRGSEVVTVPLAQLGLLVLFLETKRAHNLRPGLNPENGGYDAPRRVTPNGDPPKEERIFREVARHASAKDRLQDEPNEAVDLHGADDQADGMLPGVATHVR